MILEMTLKLSFFYVQGATLFLKDVPMFHKEKKIGSNIKHFPIAYIQGM